MSFIWFKVKRSASKDIIQAGFWVVDVLFLPIFQMFKPWSNRETPKDNGPTEVDLKAKKCPPAAPRAASNQR